MQPPPPEEWPAVQRLVAALEQAKAPPGMIKLALAGHYHDYLSDLATPAAELRQNAIEWGLPQIAVAVEKGEFDAGKQEAEWWAQTPEGMRTIALLGGN